MLLQCSACKRSFREPGFCPYDGVQLQPVPVDQRMTIASGQQPAQAPPPSVPPPARATIENPTELDDRQTFPLTPSPPGSASAPPPGSATGDQTVVRAVSAADGTDTAVRALRVRTEYDRLVGETLDGRYFVQRKIGEGGMGVVFAVRHAVIERPLAVKVLKREVMRDDATIRRFVQEARAASRIGHPNIVDVTDFGKTAEGLTYSVMEYVDGQTLATAIRHGAPLPLQRVFRIAAQIARALGVAHDKGIVHRDLKPENVFLVDRDGRPDFVKIVDFGIAKVAPLPGDANPNQPRLTRAGSVFGTPEYMAPEQAAGRGDTDGRVDIYALGVIVYEMLTGKVPHKGDSMVRTLAMQMLDPIVPPSQARPDAAIPPDVEAVVMKALAKKRDQRYQTMGELLAALDQLASTVLPAPVAASATGSPVYQHGQLPALPPGADSAAFAAVGAALLQGSRHASPSSPPPVTSGSAAAPLPRAPERSGHSAMSAVAAAPATSRRPAAEPQFVSAERPAVFVIDEEEPQRPRSRAGLVALSLVAIAAVTTATVMMIVKRRGAATVPVAASDAGLALLAADAGGPAPIAAPDAALLAQVPADAAAVVALPADAAVTLAPADAAIVAIHRPTPDAGALSLPEHHFRIDAGLLPSGPDAGGAVTHPTHEPAHPPVRITVVTRPDSAHVYVGTTYRGSSGVTLEEPFRTRYDVSCRAAGYKPGTVSLVFDGTTEVALCALTRIKICIDNIKNPFDDCEIDPTRPSPDHTTP